MTFFEMGAQGRIGQENQLMKLWKLIRWEELGKHLKGLHKNEENPQGGQKAYDALKMLKALVLQQWHELSDPGLEESLRVRLDFMMFTGFDLMEELPDETTICRFRNKLVEKGLDQKLFKEVNDQLEKMGLKVQRAKGAVIDATVIESSCRARRVIQMSEDRDEEGVEKMDSLDSSMEVKESADPDARWLKKGKRCYFGYKGFIRTDTEDGYIDEVHVTGAHEAECNKLEKLIGDQEALRLYADKAYASRGNREILKGRGIKDGIMHKAARAHPLTYWQKLKNKIISKRRFIVEQAFGTLKRRFGFTRSSYKGIKKVEAQMRWKAICFNLLKAVNKVQFA